MPDYVEEAFTVLVHVPVPEGGAPLRETYVVGCATREEAETRIKNLFPDVLDVRAFATPLSTAEAKSQKLMAGEYRPWHLTPQTSWRAQPAGQVDHRHLADTPEGIEICRRWKEWVAAQVKKYEWDIEPDDADHPTIHGLRGKGILARTEQGYEVDQIANDIGMSRQNVDHYMRFRDQMKVGADGQKRLHLVGETGLDHER